MADVNGRNVDKRKDNETIFVRNATGLVRQFGTFEHFMTNLTSIGPIFAPAFVTWFILYAVPGGDVSAATIAGLIFSVFGVLIAFAIVAATFPRAGAPYISQSRVLHPAIAWPGESMLWLSNLSFAAIIGSSYVVAWGLAPGLYVFGTETQNSAALNLATWVTTPTGLFVVGTLFLVIGLVPAILGTKVLIRTFQLPLFVLSMLGLFVTIAVLASSNTAQFATHFNALEGSSLNYTGLVSVGRQLNPGAFVPESFGLATFLIALGLTVGTSGSYWNAYAVGEMKQARSLRRQVLSMVVPSIILVASIVAIFELEKSIVGRDQLIALTQIGTLSGSSLPNPLFSGGIVTISIPYVLASSPWIVLFIMISIVGAAFAFMPFLWLTESRLLFAWSFDRLIPSKFASINDRFHVPLFSLLFVFVVAEAFMIITSFTTYLSLLFTLTWDWSAVSIGITCLACALLPLRKQLWAQSPANRLKLIGIPVASIVGLIGFFYQMNASVVYTLIPALGFGSQQAILIIASYVIVFVLFWVVRAIRRSGGIAVDLAFREIPPE